MTHLDNENQSRCVAISSTFTIQWFRIVGIYQSNNLRRYNAIQRWLFIILFFGPQQFLLIPSALQIFCKHTQDSLFSVSCFWIPILRPRPVKPFSKNSMLSPCCGSSHTKHLRHCINLCYYQHLLIITHLARWVPLLY